MKKTGRTRLLSVLMAVVMVMGAMPANAVMADEDEIVVSSEEPDSIVAEGADSVEAFSDYTEPAETDEPEYQEAAEAGGYEPDYAEPDEVEIYEPEYSESDEISEFYAETTVEDTSADVYVEDDGVLIESIEALPEDDIPLEEETENYGLMVLSDIGEETETETETETEDEYGISFLDDVAVYNVPYIDENGEEKTADEAIEVTGDDSAWSDGWYVVDSIISNSNRITVSGTVNLILADECVLTADSGIWVNFGNVLNIYGQSGSTGELIATGVDNYAAIGSNDDSNSGTITINGGVITANGGPWAAGIGGGIRGEAGEITINCGTVTATGGTQGAGIGGGPSRSGGEITISGGTVTAIGADGAGIGGGYGGDGGTITITGGEVNAEGGGSGAGIGGGPNGSGGEITISGGTVTAIGTDGAGIGSGNGADGGTITITGGTIIASCGSSGGYGVSGTFTTGTDGHAVIYASSIEGTSGSDNWSGIISHESVDGKAVVYSSPIITTDESIPSGKTAHIEEEKNITIAAGATLTNEGTVYQDWSSTFTKNGTYADNGSTYYQVAYEYDIPFTGVTTYSGNIYATSGATVSLPEGYIYADITVTKNSTGTVNLSADGSFTMPDEPVQVTGIVQRGISADMFQVDLTEETYTGNPVTKSIVGSDDGYTMSEGTDYTVSYDSNINAGTATITIEGTGVYSGTLTYEFEIVKADQELSFAEDSVEKTTLDSPFINELTGAQGNITYTSSDENVAMVDTATGEVTIISSGEATITATVEKTDNYNEATASYNITVLGVLASCDYVDANGVLNTATNVIEITKDDTVWSDGWYVVDSIISNSNRITVSGTVNLILADECVLTADSGIWVNFENVLNIYGQSGSTGELIATGVDNYAAIGSNSDSNSGTITINGGVITANGGPWAAGIGGGIRGKAGEITINGGTVTAYGGAQGAGIGNGSSTSEGGTITINGGTVEAFGDTSYGSAGIGGSYSCDGGTITITGGKVNAEGGGSGAGIGGGPNGSGGEITISGGTVTAIGTDGAGIGGGGGADGGMIAIIGGEVTAESTSMGAGIGGGSNGSGGEITISGGTVTATGTDGAGIGGGYNSDGGTITITDGEVMAESTSKGAGIGGGMVSSGHETNGGTIIISGGFVTAMAPYGGGAGIGGGYCGYGDTIEITGGTVIAGGNRGIGSGYDTTTGAENTTIENCVIYASKIMELDETIHSGLIYSGTSDGPTTDYGPAVVYGSPVFSSDVQIPEGMTALIEDGKTVTIAQEGTLTNEGGLYQNWGSTFINNGTYADNGTTYYEIKHRYYNLISIPEAVTFSDSFYAKENTTVTISVLGGYEISDFVLTHKNGDIVTPEADNSLVLSEPVKITAHAGVGDFSVSGGILGTDYLYEDQVLTILSASPLTITMAEDVEKTKTDCIVADDGVEADLTLDGVYIDMSSYADTAAMDLQEAGACTIRLADGSENTLLSGQNRAGIEVPDGFEIIFDGSGTLTATGGKNAPGIGNGTEGNEDRANIITINNGTITANGGTNASGIGGGSHSDGGIITIKNGNVTASGGTSGAGIGGGDGGDGGTITIYGGTITATGGGDGAGIGGGTGYTMGGDGGTIMIYGGTITATGGLDGAGIGGGYNGDGGTIMIEGGNVTAATNYGYAAGIGGGFRSAGGEITITDGNVVATGGIYAAGIGGGYPHLLLESFMDGNDSGNSYVTITGGTVWAYGGAEGPGIGCITYASNMTTVTISGGTVIAVEGGSSGGGGAHRASAPNTFAADTTLYDENAYGISGTFTTGTDGHAVIYASSIEDTSDSENWSGASSPQNR